MAQMYRLGPTRGHRRFQAALSVQFHMAARRVRNRQPGVPTLNDRHLLVFCAAFALGSKQWAPPPNFWRCHAELHRRRNAIDSFQSRGASKKESETYFDYRRVPHLNQKLTELKHSSRSHNVFFMFFAGCFDSPQSCSLHASDAHNPQGNCHYVCAGNP